MICCLAIETLHGIYYNAKIIAGSKDLAIIKNGDGGYRAFPGFIKDLKNQDPDKELIVSSPDHYYLYAASQMGLSAVFDYENLSKDSVALPHNSLLIMLVHENEIPIIKSYLEKKRPQLLSVIANTYFYKEEIN
jgi:hypothetical protein